MKDKLMDTPEWLQAEFPEIVVIVPYSIPTTFYAHRCTVRIGKATTDMTAQLIKDAELKDELKEYVIAQVKAAYNRSQMVA